MKEDKFDENDKSSDEIEENVLPMWELLFNEREKKENCMILKSLLNKKVKVWSVLASTVSGVRGTYKGQVGVLTSYDDEFIVLDNAYCLSRKFIYRIEKA